LIGCLWQRINGPLGGTVDGVTYSGRNLEKWGAYFKVPENTILKANPKNKIMTRTTATELVQDKSGRITGVKARRFDGTQVEITAKKGVILATGGYGANIKMVMDTNAYWSPQHLTAVIKTTNRNLAQGEGLVMAQKAGAAITGMGWTQLMPLGWVDNGNLAMGTGENVIYISPAGTPNAGKRYVNEAAERDVLSQAAYDHGGTNGLFVELGNFSSVPPPVLPPGPKSSADNIEGRVYFCTLPEAASLLKIDEAVLRKTITDYDAYIIGASKTPSQPPKTAYTAIIGECDKDAAGKYIPATYRLNQVVVRFMAPSTHHTMGGLKVDTERRVLSAQGKAIPGLYAAGEVTGGVFAGNRLGGNAIVEIIVSGRIAGASVVKN
jgi:fumarate reductase flavoprotein subunit